MTKAVALFGLGFLFMFALLTGVRAAFVFAYAMLLVFVLAAAWARLSSAGIRLTTRLDSGRRAVGEPFLETFELRKSGWVYAPWVEVSDAGDTPGYRPGRVVSLGREPRRWSERGVYGRRGWVRFGPTKIRLREPFGLFEQEVEVRPATRVLVYPRVVPLPYLPTAAIQQAGDAPRLGAWADQPPESGGVREYASGDAYGRIHWPLSLKHGHLISKTFEQPLTADLWLVLDLFRGAHHGRGPESTLEYAVTLAASIAMQVLERGRSVGLVANDAPGTIIEPTRLGRPEQPLLDYLALAQADGQTPLARALVRERVRRLPRRSVALITPSSDPEWMGAMRALAGKRAARLVFYLDATSFGAPDQPLSFDLGADVDLYIVRRGDDLSRVARMRDAVHVV